MAVAAYAPRMAEETSQLLRRRLSALTVMFAAVLIWILAATAGYGSHGLVGFRIAVLAAVLGLSVLLHSRLSLGPLALRSLELASVGLFGLQLAVVWSNTLCQVGSQGNAVGAVVSLFSNYAGWSLLIMGYGIFVPNTWKRSAMIALPAALIPTLVVWVARLRCPALEPLLDVQGIDWLRSLPFVTALAAVLCGAYAGCDSSRRFRGAPVRPVSFDGKDRRRRHG